MAAQNPERFQAIVEAATRELVSVSECSGAQYVTTPLMYVSGAYVVVRVEMAGSNFIVSDFGSGHQEAEMLGGDLIYRRLAPSVAAASGVKFDHFAFFAMLAREDQLPSAIATVANCSHEAVLVTSARVAEKRARDDAQLLYERLTTIFPRRSVAKDAALVGASNTEWHFASIVEAGRNRVAFEAVTKHPNSIVFASTKFRDVARLQRPPGRVAVVEKKKLLGTYLAVLSESATVVEAGVEDTVFRELVAA